MSTKITVRQSELAAIPGGWVRRDLVPANDICKSGWLALYTQVSGSRKKNRMPISRIAYSGMFVG